MSKTALAEKVSIENGTKIATEAILNIRTVASLSERMLYQIVEIKFFLFSFFNYVLGQEKPMIARYISEMMKVKKIIQRKTIWRGLVNSIAQSIPFFGYAVALCYGGFLVAHGEIHFKIVIK